MRFIRNYDPVKCKFKDLAIGDVFAISGGVYYMKTGIYNVPGTVGPINYIALDGSFGVYEIGPKEEVYKVDCELIVSTKQIAGAGRV